MFYLISPDISWWSGSRTGGRDIIIAGVPGRPGPGPVLVVPIVSLSVKVSSDQTTSVMTLL